MVHGHGGPQPCNCHSDQWPAQLDRLDRVPDLNRSKKKVQQRLEYRSRGGVVQKVAAIPRHASKPTVIARQEAELNHRRARQFRRTNARQSLERYVDRLVVSLQARQKAHQNLRRRAAGLSRIARFYLEHLFLDRNEAITAMLRAALGDPGCVPALRTVIQDTLVAGVAGALAVGAALVQRQRTGRTRSSDS